MDHYADDLAAVTAHLDLKNAIHVGHSTAAATVVRYIARHGKARVAEAAIVSAVPPLMLQTSANPNGQPRKVFDDFQVALAANRSQFYRDIAAGPFYNYNKSGKPAEATIQNRWRQGMMAAQRRSTTASSPFRKPISPRTSSRSTFRSSSCAARVIETCSRRCRATVLEVAEERDLETSERLSARHADHPSQHDQRRSSRVLPTSRVEPSSSCS